MDDAGGHAMNDGIDTRLRAVGRAARAEVEAGLDLEAELAAVLAARRTDLRAVGDPTGPGSRGPLPWLAAAAAVVVVVMGGALLLRRDDTIEVTDPATTEPPVVAPPSTVPSTVPTTAPPTTATTDTAMPTTTVPTTTVVPGDALIRPGSIDLGPDDVIARAVDGDVWWYPGAFGESPGERILLIEREDPRPEPDEGSGPNYVDHVAGTFDGSLVYGDCCEPVSGTLYAIAEPGAEADLFADPVGESEVAQSWGIGYDPTFEPDGTRIVAINWDYLAVTDLASGAQQSLLLGELGDVGGLDVGWADGSVAALVWSFEDGLLLTIRDPADLTVELARADLAPPADQMEAASIVGVTDAAVVVSIGEGTTRQLVAVGIGTWAVDEWDPPFDVPADATSPHLTDGGTTMSWVVGEQGIVQRSGGDPVLVDDGLAEVWIPQVRGVGGGTEPTTTDTTGTTEPTIPSTTVPAASPTARPIDWRTLPSEDSGIPDSCIRASLICTRLIHDPDGTPISYDPTTRRLTRHGVPEVAVTLPDSYGTRPWLYHAGPDDVVYLQVAPAVPAELAADLVAITLADGDAGREIARWDDVVNDVGDDELVATADGLVRVGCCGPDPVRPAPDAEVVVPWLDRGGAEVSSTTPTIGSRQSYPDLTITRTDAVPSGTREWTFRPPDDWLGRGMTQVTPTFDGGFVAALQVSNGVTVARGRPTGEVEQVTLADVLAVALDPVGRVLLGDGDSVIRIAPFADRTPQLAEQPVVDVEAGTITVGEIPDLDANWRFDPVAFAEVLAGTPAVNEVRSIEASQRSESEWLVTVITSNFFDDSVFAVRWELALARDDAGRFSVVSGAWANACQPGRGHQDFENALCA